jgi:hypothetical protein
MFRYGRSRENAWFTDFDAVDGEHDRMLRYTRLEIGLNTLVSTKVIEGSPMRLPAC